MPGTSPGMTNGWGNVGAKHVEGRDKPGHDGETYFRFRK